MPSATPTTELGTSHPTCVRYKVVALAILLAMVTYLGASDFLVGKGG